MIEMQKDRCPHRGTRLSIGRIYGDEVVCAYHGWHFDGGARCTLVPALPGVAEKMQARMLGWRAGERYGLIWVCIVENFLDMAHFSMVHTGILGDPSRSEVRDYDVAEFDDGQGGKGVLATHCFAWQPQTNSLAHGGSEVELRAFQDRIFLQDKPILENQVPKKLPLDPGAEMPVRCDRMSLAYRRYLRDKALQYGVVTAAAPVRA